MKKSVQKVGMEQLRSCHGQGTSAEELQDSQISEVVIKKAQAGDLPRILEIYAYAREFMKRTGNPNQWKENAPQKEVLEADIRAGQLYVVRQKNRMTGVFALVIGKDPTYAQIVTCWYNPNGQKADSTYRIDAQIQDLQEVIPLLSQSW